MHAYMHTYLRSYLHTYLHTQLHTFTHTYTVYTSRKTYINTYNKTRACAHYVRCHDSCRMLHHRWVYARVHKQHHMFNATVGIAAEFAHPIEDLLANLLPTLLGPLLCGAHLCVLSAWVTLRVTETAGESTTAKVVFTSVCVTTEAHSGYEFPFSPFVLITKLTGATSVERCDILPSLPRNGGLTYCDSSFTQT
jgi:hypothetical protein